MVKYLLTLALLLLLTNISYANFEASGGLGTPISYNENLTNSGINQVYVFNTLYNANIIFTTTNSSIVRFYKYTTSETDKELISLSDINTTNTSSSTTYTIKNLEDGKGYFAEVNGKISDVIWIVDYTKHIPLLNSIQFSTENDVCEEKKIQLIIDKSDNLFFYSRTGSRHQITRKYDIDFKALVWDGKSKAFIEKSIDDYKNLDIGTDYSVSAPLQNTQFKLSGDQFAKEFGMDFSIVSSAYTEKAVEAHIVYEQLTESSSGTQTTPDLINAPTEFELNGIGNEPTAYYYTWFIYKDTDLNNPIVKYTDKNINYTFRESGKYKVVLEVADKSSTCADTNSFNIETSESYLDVPNFLVIDGKHEFRVTYKSLSSFRCTIFNRWGNKISEFTDPSLGWDGKYKGKYVNPGVYFYVIKATGSDGKKLKKSGDINVLRPR